MLLLKKYSIIIVTMCHTSALCPTALIKCLAAANDAVAQRMRIWIILRKNVS